MSTGWIIILIFLAFLIFGTSGPAATRSGGVDIATVDPGPVGIAINGNPGVILDVASYSRDHDGWTPSVVDIQEAEDAVPAAVTGEREPEIDGYRQYVGIIEDGELKIVINSMCHEVDGWDEEFIMIADGGPCFWNALYNVDTREMEYVIVNGVA